MRTLKPEAALCALIMAGYLLAGTLFALVTPAWQAPDEPAHYNAIRQIAESGCCPRIEAGDWNSDALQQLKSARFASPLLDDLDEIQYEDHQPPLYYLLASLIFKLSAGHLITLRLFSVLLGAGVVALAYHIGKLCAPRSPQVALGGMALAAFLPQHLAMLSAVNNDALAELIVGAGLLWSLRHARGEATPIWQMGCIAGLALLCKATVYFLLPLMCLAIWLRWRAEGGLRALLLRRLAGFLLISLLIGGGWWLRNSAVYGFPDILSLAAHDAVVADQPRTADYVAEHGLARYLSQFAAVTFKSFVGQFGWMALPLDAALGGWIYRGFALLMILGVSGLLLPPNPADGERVDARTDRSIALLFGAAVIMVALAHVVYNLEFVQWQGRYLFPALIPIAIGLVVGLDKWRARFLAGGRWLVPLGLLGLLPLDLYLLLRVIGPGLSP